MAIKLTDDKLSRIRAVVRGCAEKGSWWYDCLLLLDEHAALTARVAELEASNAKLEKESDFLDALRAEGVDNWSGYDEAVRRLYSEED